MSVPIWRDFHPFTFDKPPFFRYNNDMQTSRQRQKAQIGITTVILSIILLYIGVSVSWRIVRDTQQEAARSESTQAQIVAEQMVSLSGYSAGERYNQGAVSGGGTAADSSVKQITPSRGNNFDMIYVKVGEAIAVTVKSSMLDPDGTLPRIYYGYGSSNNPKLLIRRIYNEGGKTQSEQDFIGSTSCSRSCSASVGGYCVNGFRCYHDSGLKFHNGETATIMVLTNDSYIGMEGLAKHYRAASYAQGHGDGTTTGAGDTYNSGAQGNEARVVEQLETEPTTPGMFQFSVLVNGQIKGNN